MKEFKINDFLTLRLEDGKTNIYVEDELFLQCKHVMLYYKIVSHEGVRSFLRKDIDPETEFWAHCSNLQAWYEHDYDTQLLDNKSLSFPLLKRLYDSGETLARRVFNDEIIRQLENGHNSVYLFLEDYMDYIDREYLLEKIPFRGTLIPIIEANALNRAEKKMTKTKIDRFELVDNFGYKLERYCQGRGRLGEDFWDFHFQFYVRDQRVEGIAILDTKGCDGCTEYGEWYSGYRESGEEQPDFCSDCGIIEIPLSLLDLSHLKVLYIEADSSKNDLDLPIWIQNIKSLETLYLKGICTKNLSLILGGLPNLKILVINECDLGALPSTFASLKKLRILDLTETSITQIPEEIGELTRLEYLFLNENSLKEVPSSLVKLKHLRVLYLKQYKSYQKLETFPDPICKIFSLKELYLDGTSITQLPEAIGNLTNLEVLSLNGTKITSLPETIGNLKKLEVLNLARCRLNSIPDSITQLSLLKTINIYGNILSGISQETTNFLLESGIIPKEHMLYLQMDKAQAQALYEIETILNKKLYKVQSLTKTRVPDIYRKSDNNEYILENHEIIALRLNYVHSELLEPIQKLKSLKTLDIYKGNLTISSFLVDLENLDSLKLISCNILNISNLEKLVRLKLLDLSHNKISEIKGLETLENLSMLSLNSNRISEIKNLASNSNLKKLLLNYNQITEINGLDNLTKLTHLELSNNQITEIKGLDKLTKLDYLDLDHNQIEEIKGLENLIDLRHFSHRNKIPKGSDKI